MIFITKSYLPHWFIN